LICVPQNFARNTILSSNTTNFFVPYAFRQLLLASTEYNQHSECLFYVFQLSLWTNSALKVSFLCEWAADLFVWRLGWSNCSSEWRPWERFVRLFKTFVSQNSSALLSLSKHQVKSHPLTHITQLNKTIIIWKPHNHKHIITYLNH
jgi:hypothetical protein